MSAAAPGFIDPEADPLSRVGYLLSLIVIPLLFGRLIEFAPAFVGVARPVILLSACLMGCALLSNSYRRIFRSPIVILLLGFTLWSATGMVFGVWRGGSARFLITVWLPALLPALVVACFLSTAARCRGGFKALAATAVGILVLGAFHGDVQQGRYGLDNSGILGNANSVAMILLMVLPVSIWLVTQSRGIRRLIAIPIPVAAAVLSIRTGSRAGLITLILLAVAAFLRSGFTSKIKLIAAAAIIGAVGFATTTESARARLASLIRDEAESESQLSAMQSSQGRHEVLKRSIIQTLRNPIVGVGIGMFPVADRNWAEKEQVRALWRVSHNAYTQVSSETGIPGLMLYLAALILCLRTTWRMDKAVRSHAGLAELQSMVFALRLSVLAYAVEALFSSSAYECYFPMLAGLTASCDLTIRDIIATDEQRLNSPLSPTALAPNQRHRDFARIPHPILSGRLPPA